MSDVYGADAYSPKEIAARIETVGVTKARMGLLPMGMLGILAGAFIGLGGLFFILVRADATLGFATSQLLSGLVFCLGLLLVVVAGAELFTGNNLIVMAWADGQIQTHEVLRNWIWVFLANFIGAFGLALLVAWSGHAHLHGDQVGQTVVRVALAKQNISMEQAFFRGVLCNVLVCLAVWMAMGGRSVTDKVLAIVWPITAFVAAGFEHSIANLYFFSLALILQAMDPMWGHGITVLGMLGNLVPVLLGNVVGGSVFVGLVYFVIYRQPRP